MWHALHCYVTTFDFTMQLSDIGNDYNNNNNNPFILTASLMFPDERETY